MCNQESGRLRLQKMCYSILLTMKELREFIQRITPEISDLELDYIVSKFTIKTLLMHTIERLKSFQFETAEDRYNKIISDPNYTQRLPLKDLASFLGVTQRPLTKKRCMFTRFTATKKPKHCTKRATPTTKPVP